MSLQKITGKIKKVGAYPLSAPKTVNFNGEEKTFTHRHALQMETGEWIGFGESHLDSFLVKDDDGNFQILGAGSEVLIKYTASGDYKNAKKSHLTVLDLVVGEKYSKAPKSQTPNKSSPSKPAPIGNKDFVNPAEVGQCLNLSVDVLGLDSKQLLDKDEVTKAIQWYKEVRGLFSDLYPKVEAAAPKEKKAPAPEPVVEDEYDDQDV